MSFNEKFKFLMQSLLCVIPIASNALAGTKGPSVDKLNQMIRTFSETGQYLSPEELEEKRIKQEQAKQQCLADLKQRQRIREAKLRAQEEHYAKLVEERDSQEKELEIIESTLADSNARKAKLELELNEAKAISEEKKKIAFDLAEKLNSLEELLRQYQLSTAESSLSTSHQAKEIYNELNQSNVSEMRQGLTEMGQLKDACSTSDRGESGEKQLTEEEIAIDQACIRGEFDLNSFLRGENEKYRQLREEDEQEEAEENVGESTQESQTVQVSKELLEFRARLKNHRDTFLKFFSKDNETIGWNEFQNMMTALQAKLKSGKTTGAHFKAVFTRAAAVFGEVDQLNRRSVQQKFSTSVAKVHGRKGQSDQVSPTSKTLIRMYIFDPLNLTPETLFGVREENF